MKESPMLEKLVSQHKEWRELDRDVADGFLNEYFRSVNGRYMNGATAFEWVTSKFNNPSIIGHMTRFHEKAEIQELRRMGYTNSQITSSGAYWGNLKRKNDWYTAHGNARYREYKFIQDIAKILAHKDIPISALALVSPAVEAVGERDKIGLLSPKFVYLNFVGNEELVRRENLSEQDIKNAIKFFEKGGWVYRHKKDVLEQAKSCL